MVLKSSIDNFALSIFIFLRIRNHENPKYKTDRATECLFENINGDNCDFVIDDGYENLRRRTLDWEKN